MSEQKKHNISASVLAMFVSLQLKFGENVQECEVPLETLREELEEILNDIVIQQHNDTLDEAIRILEDRANLVGFRISDGEKYNELQAAMVEDELKKQADKLRDKKILET